jgi:hypothetical protein
MFKTISAALLAVSVLAAPTFAATAKTEQTPTTKSSIVQVKKSHLNSHARRHHVRYMKHHRIHTKMAAKVHKTLKVSKLHNTHKPLKVSAKPVKHPAKRG